MPALGAFDTTQKRPERLMRRPETNSITGGRRVSRAVRNVTIGEKHAKTRLWRAEKSGIYSVRSREQSKDLERSVTVQCAVSRLSGGKGGS